MRRRIYQRTRTEVIDNPGVRVRPYPTGVHNVYKAKGNDAPCSAAWVKENWGDPEHIRAPRKKGQAELWTYRFRPVWCGVTIGVIVPIPLVLPVAREKVTFFVRDEEIIRAKVVEERCSGLGFAGNPEGGFVGLARW